MAQEESSSNKSKSSQVDLDNPSFYFNRELSWLQFNWRVLEEALDESHPLLERTKFLSIFSNNLDEFFMIRVSGLRQQLASVNVDTPPDGMTSAEQLAAIRRQLIPMLNRQMNCWQKDVLPKLHEEGIHVLSYGDLKGKQRKLLRRHFEQEIFPTLTPLAIDPGHPFPHISNLSVNLAVVLNDPAVGGERLARVKAPGIFPRLLRIPSEETVQDYEEYGLEEVLADNFVWMEDVVAANLDLLFPGLEIVGAYPFRVTRDADLDIEEDEASDLLSNIEEQVGMRYFGSAVRLEVGTGVPERILDALARNLDLSPYQVYTADGPIGLANLMELMQVDRPELKDTPFSPATPAVLSHAKDIFTAIRRKEILLYHPYDSFSPVTDFVRQAARDPDVLAIKQTLYRTGLNSPIIAALKEARENGKQVAALVELKARFDEENNIVWGAGFGKRRGARSLWAGWPQDPRQNLPGRPSRARRHHPLRSYGNRQLQCGHGAHLRRHRVFHL